jgi:dihydrofolate reductase
MRRVVVSEFLSLDGVAQAPGGPDEDRDGGFRHGGWHMVYVDELAGAWVNTAVAEAGALLLGRRTYEIFAAYWPNAPAEEWEIARPLNEMPKYVVSHTLKEPLAWQNSRLLPGAGRAADHVAQAIAELRGGEGGEEAGGRAGGQGGDGKNLLVFGSTQLVHTLIEFGLVDEFRLMIDPVILGPGKRIFLGGGTAGCELPGFDPAALRALRLAESRVTKTGAILARYVPAVSAAPAGPDASAVPGVPA